MKKALWGLGFIVVLVLGVLGYMLTTELASVVERNEEEAVTETEGVETNNKKVEAGKVLAHEENGNPFGTSTKLAEMNDKLYQDYLHGMSHQKVEADEKWGFYPITEKRIQWLLNGLDITELKHEKEYRKILERWASGNFSKVDIDHNIIWEMQNGNIGKATGILSPEEEQAYIESQN
ncbi:DUF6241 domain-containing protein [Oceanobacillus sp. Castelsardo]|uniref:DUF6241 domain-containing protein n=1 Tax=Oceanobacillus sp. Castelsardo TaxID=1851204 RepID=UPI00083928FA|nr:DUF6241 domain-containing protein [Oceanobacillus sp. Castelsardo]